MITLKETVELTCSSSINSFSDILGKKIRENYRTMDAAVSRLELFYLMTVMPDIIVERKKYYRQLFYLKTQMPSIKLTGYQPCSKTELGGIQSSRQLPNILDSAAVRLVARGNKLENRQEIHLKIETRNLPVKVGKERFGRGPWDKSGKYGPFGEMQRSMHKQLKTEHFHVLNDYGTGVFITEKRVLKLFSRLEREKWNGTENKSLAEPTENNALSQERLVNVENDIRMSEKSLIHSVKYPAANWRGIKLAAQQSCGKFAPCGSRQISAPARLSGLLLAGIKNIIFQTESQMRGQDKIVLISKGLTDQKGDIALQSNFLADSAGDIDIIQRSENPAEPKGGIVEQSRSFLYLESDLIQQRRKLEESQMNLILQRGRLAESIKEVIRQSEKLADSKGDIIKQSRIFSEFKRNFIWQRERLSESKKELILQRGKQLELKKKGIRRSENLAEQKGEIVKPSRYFSDIKREFIQQREKQSEWKKVLILQRGKLSEPIKESILRSETMADSKGEIIKQSKIFSEFKIGLIQRSEKQSELKGNIIQQSRILPEPKRELIQRVEKLAELRGDIIQRSRTLPESTRESILQTGNLAEPQTEYILQERNLAETQTERILQDRNLTEIKKELLLKREYFPKSKTDAVLTDKKQVNFDSEIIMRRDNHLNLWDNTTLKTQSTTNLQYNAVLQTKEMANLHGSIRQTEGLTEQKESFTFQNDNLTTLQKNIPRQDKRFTEPMGDTTQKEEPLIHLPDQPKPQADTIQPKSGQTDDQKLFQYLSQVNEHNLKMQRRLEQIKPEAQNEIPFAIDKKEARKKSLLALKDPEKVLMEIDRSGGNPMSKTDSKIQSILNLADQDTRLLLEDVMAYPKTGQGRAFQITETDMGELNHFLRKAAEEPPGFQEISRETEKSQRDAEEIRKETVKITREEMEKNSRILMQNVEELLQSKMESVSDRVYRELERRLKNDQRRRGY